MTRAFYIAHLFHVCNVSQTVPLSVTIENPSPVRNKICFYMNYMSINSFVVDKMDFSLDKNRRKRVGGQGDLKYRYEIFPKFFIFDNIQSSVGTPMKGFDFLLYCP